ncbi:MAG TPA: VOC family protein [Gaiella sp.]|jgi:catechol 2,3-dioxygenase-like lactoylglutathione lyase family enzyme|nr:VOC family protein [Gaiella sp.]
MLGNHDAGATLAVSDMAAARSFYEGTLGLAPAMEMGDAVLYTSGGSRVLVYQSDYAGTNKATAATWSVGDGFDSVVAALRGKGVEFEHYDGLPGVTRDGDVHAIGEARGVWITDPDGNILSIVDQP